MSEKYRAPALDKGLDIIEFLAHAPNGMSQMEIAKGIGRGPNEIYRMLDTLLRRRYIVRSTSGDKYMLSLRILSLANIHPPRRRLLDIAEPLMRLAVAECEQSLHLAMWEDGDIVVTSSFSAPGNWRLSLRAGSVVGLYNTGSGLVLAAFQSEDTRARMVAEHILADGESKLSGVEFGALVEKTRRVGYAKAPSQTTVGTINLSFPVMDDFGNAVAALTCPFLKRIDNHAAPDISQVFSIMNDTARNISKQLGPIGKPAG